MKAKEECESEAIGERKKKDRKDERRRRAFGRLSLNITEDISDKHRKSILL